MSEAVDGLYGQRPGSTARRVLLVVQPTLGGVPRHVEQILTYTDTRQVHLSLAAPPGPLLERVREAGHPAYALPMVRQPHPGKDWRALLGLYRLLRDTGPYHILHAHSAKAGVLGRLLRSVGAAPAVVFTPHAFSFLSAEGRQRAFYRGLEKCLRPWTDRLIAVGASEAALAGEALHYTPERIRLIPNGIEWRDLATITPRRGADVVWVGRPSFQKNADMLLRVLDLLGQTGVKPQVLMIGAGQGENIESEATERLHRDLVSMGLHHQVQVVGWLPWEEVMGYVAGAKVLVQTSRYEGLPYNLLEAMALGIPIIATDTIGNCDAVQHEQTGLLVPLDDDAAMAAALRTLLPDAARRAQMSSASRQRVQQVFDARASVAALEKVYQELSA